MDEIVHVGFQSPTLSFVKDMTIEELIELIVKRATTRDEALKAIDMLSPVWTSGRFDGTGWHFWFVRKPKMIH